VGAAAAAAAAVVAAAATAAARGSVATVARVCAGLGGWWTASAVPRRRHS